MDLWRYRMLEETDEIAEASGERRFYVDGDTENQSDWSTSLIKIINDWGSDGWDLVAVIPKEKPTYIFKKRAGL